MGEVEAFMEQFKEENIELIWGLSKDASLEDGEVKVTVLATGFGMKDIPDMRPIIQKDEEMIQELSREEEEKRQKEEEKLENMLGVFYKPDFKVYIFKGEEMHNEEFLAALDNSPTYSRTAQDLERMTSMIQAVAQEETEEAAVEENEICDETEQEVNS